MNFPVVLISGSSFRSRDMGIQIIVMSSRAAATPFDGGGGSPLMIKLTVSYNCLHLSLLRHNKTHSSPSSLSPTCFSPPPPIPLNCISGSLCLKSLRGAVGLSWEENWTENRVYFQITFPLSHSNVESQDKERPNITCLVPSSSSWTKR